MKRLIAMILCLLFVISLAGCGKCISFDSSFRSPKNGGGAWNANEEYTWSWWLARSEGGTWKLMTWGY